MSPYLPHEKVKKEQLEEDIEQGPASKLETEYVNVVYCHPVYLTHRESSS